MIIKYLIIIYIGIAGILYSQSYGTITFTNYLDDKKAAFSFTFDDGLLTHNLNVRPILNQYGFKGTFYVLPPYLAEDNQPLIWRYGYWSDFKSLASEDHEIGSHTMNHFDLTTLPWGNINQESTLLYEIYQSKIFIEQKIPFKKCISLNYPYTLHNSLVDSAAGLYYENGRSLGQLPNESSINDKEWFKLRAKVVTFNQPRYSFVDDLDELYSFLEWTQNSIDNKKWGIIIIHDVVPASQLPELVNQGIYEPISNEWLEALCDFLSIRSNNNEVWVETVGNVTRYIKERDAAEPLIISTSDQLIEISVSDNLPDNIFNYPLSAYVKIPDDWYYVRTEQSGNVDTLTTSLTDTGRVVLVKVIPDNGNLKITPIITTSVDDEVIGLEEFILYQNYPNPFNPSTIISWQSPVSGWQTLKVYDVLGNEVAVLLDEYKLAGMYNVQFTMDNLPAGGQGGKLSSGLYFYQLKAGDYFETKKMMYLK